MDKDNKVSQGDRWLVGKRRWQGEDRRCGVCITGISGKNREDERRGHTQNTSENPVQSWCCEFTDETLLCKAPSADKDLCPSAARRASQEGGLIKTVVSKGEGKQDRYLENNTESWKPMGQYFYSSEGEMRYAILDCYLWIDDAQTWSWNKGVFKEFNYKNSLTMRLSSGRVGHFSLQRKKAEHGLEMEVPEQQLWHQASGSPSRWASETEPVRGDFQNKGLHVARSAQIH